MQTFQNNVSQENVYACGLSGPEYVSGTQGQFYTCGRQGQPYVSATSGCPYTVSSNLKECVREITKKVTVPTGDFQVTEQLDYVLLDNYHI